MSSGVTIRRAEQKDAVALAQVHDEAWRGAYQGIIPGVQLERILSRAGPASWERQLRSGQRRSGLIAMELNGAVCGYACAGPSRTHPRHASGEIYEIYLRPAYQGVGLGGKLFGAARRLLEVNGLHGLVVWALADNTTACAFYAGLGGKLAERRDEALGETMLARVAFLWPKHARARPNTLREG